MRWPTWSGTGHWPSHCLAPGEGEEGAGYWGAVINSSAELFSFSRHFSWLCCRYKTNGWWQSLVWTDPSKDEYWLFKNLQNYASIILNDVHLVNTFLYEWILMMWEWFVFVNDTVGIMTYLKAWQWQDDIYHAQSKLRTLHIIKMLRFISHISKFTSTFPSLSCI